MGTSRQTLTFLFVDIVKSTDFKGSVEEDVSKPVFDRCFAIFAECMPADPAAGKMQTNTGDGMYAWFPSPTDAVETALRIQWRFHGENWPLRRIEVRQGLDMGDASTIFDPVHQEDQPYTFRTHVTARIMDLAQPGQILMSRDVRSMVSTTLGRHPFARDESPPDADLTLQRPIHGNYRYKGDKVDEGLEEPIEIAEIRPVALGPCVKPGANDKGGYPCDGEGRAISGWTPWVGDIVPGISPNKWQLEQRLGVGGFGTVWLARDLSTDDVSAFKFCDDRLRAQSFVREWKLFLLLRKAVSLDPALRPNIAVLQSSSLQSIKGDDKLRATPPFWIQSDYYPEGNILEWALKRHGKPEDQLTPNLTPEEKHEHLCKALALIDIEVRLNLWVELARTVHAVHQHHITHRDIKPTNILIRLDPNDGSPHPVLADFGIGTTHDPKSLEALNLSQWGFHSSDFNIDSSRTGTALYRPQEAVLRTETTQAWDIHALAVLLYQFVRGDATLPLSLSWDQHVDDPILRADIRKGVLDGDKRWPTAADFVESVAERHERRRVMEEENARKLLKSEQQKARRLQFIIVATACLTLVVAGMAMYSWRQSKIARAAEITAKKAVLASEEAESKAYDQIIEAARKAQGIALDAFEKREDLPTGFAHLAEAVRYNCSLPSNRQLQAIDREAVTRLLTHPLPAPIPLTEPMRHDASVNRAVFSPDSQRIVTVSDDKTARLWDAASGQPLGEPMRHEGKVYWAVFSFDGQRIVSGDDKTARIWDASSGKRLGVPMHHEDWVCTADFSPDGQRVVTASWDKTARLWDATSGKPLGEPMRHTGTVNEADFSPDGQRVVTASNDKTARLWDAASGKPLGEPMRHEDIVLCADFSPDGQRVVTASYDKTARLWDSASGKPLGAPLRHEGRVKGACFSRNSQRVLTVDDEETVRLWDANTGKPIGEPMRHEDIVENAMISGDSQRVVTASWDKTARLWDATSGKPVGVPMRHDGIVYRAVFSPDCQRVVTASDYNTVRLWDAASGKPMGEPMRHERRVWSVLFSPDGQHIVTASYDNTARLWDVASSKPLGLPIRHEDRVNSAMFSPNGQRAITASDDKTARLWDMASGKPLGVLKGHEGGLTVASFSPDGQRIVTASWDKTARLWDATSGKPIGEPMRHEGTVWSGLFGPDGQHVVTASDDKTARLWDAASGKPLGVPMRHENNVSFAAFTLDGRRVITLSRETARLWDVANSKLLGIASESELNAVFVPQNLGEDEISSHGAKARVLGLPSQSVTAEFNHLTEWGGLRINGDGQSETITNAERAKWRMSIFALTPAALTTWDTMLRWSLSDPRTRSINFTSNTSVPEHVEREITWALVQLEVTRKDDSSGVSDHSVLTDAYALNPGFPLIHVALAAIQENAASRDFLIAYGLKTLAAWEKTPEAKTPPGWAPAPGHLRAKTAIILWLQDQKLHAKEVFAELLRIHDPHKQSWGSKAWIEKLPNFEWPQVFRDTLMELAK